MQYKHSNLWLFILVTPAKHKIDFFETGFAVLIHLKTFKIFFLLLSPLPPKYQLDL